MIPSMPVIAPLYMAVCAKENDGLGKAGVPRIH